jgi:hypothetical protein
MGLDLFFDSAALQLKEPNLFPELLFEEPEGGQRHGGQRDSMITVL